MTKRSKIRMFVHEIEQLLDSKRRVVIEISEFQSAIDPSNQMDSLTLFPLIRELAWANRWSIFIFDYGTKVHIGRLRRERSMGVGGADGS